MDKYLWLVESTNFVFMKSNQVPNLERDGLGEVGMYYSIYTTYYILVYCSMKTKWKRESISTSENFGDVLRNHRFIKGIVFGDVVLDRSMNLNFK